MTSLEKTANIAVILTCCLAGWSIVSRSISKPHQPSAYAAGARIKDTAELAVGSAARSILLVTSSRCHFCSESMPYYVKLVEAARRSGTRIVALSSEQPSGNRAFLTANGVSVDTFASAPGNGVLVPGTPTIIVVRRDGTVLGSWTGKLSAPLESRVIQLATGG